MITVPELNDPKSPVGLRNNILDTQVIQKEDTGDMKTYKDEERKEAEFCRTLKVGNWMHLFNSKN